MVNSDSGLKAVDLAYTYQAPLFRGLGFEVLPGEALQVLGENGQGKTTLLRMLAGLLEPESGQLFWRGVEVRKCPDTYQKDLIYLGHQLALKSYLTVQENLLLSVRLRGYGVEASQLSAIVSQLGLEAHHDQFAYQLSAGQRQRLALARLLAAPGHLWILDEPFSVLSQQGQRWLSDLMGSHLRQGGIVIFTSHHPVDLRGISPSMLTL